MSLASSIQMPSTAAAEEDLKDRVTCRLCRRQFAKYTCPTCNVPYCSLTCFRSQAHNQCSEGFYKKEIERDIHAGPSKTAQERQQMMEMLRKFEEESTKDQSLLETDEDEEEDGSDLARRFEAIDFEFTSPDALWAMLTPAERSKFVKVFEDPTSELAQQLLASEQLEKEIQEPWWEGQSTGEDDDEDNEQEHRPRIPRRHGARPTMMNIPLSMVKPVPAGHPLVYNMCAICVAYAYITRHLGTSSLYNLKPEGPEYHEARRLVAQLVPFLTDRKSTTLYPSMSAMITDIWSRFDMGKMTSDLFSLLLQDAAHLLKPLHVTQVASPDTEQSGKEESVPSSHPRVMPILVLSDLHELFSNKPPSGTPRGNHVIHKLLFYAAHILSTPNLNLQVLVGEMEAMAEKYKQKEALEATSVERKSDERGRKLVEEM